ncbi:uncharacterized protein LAJ45_08309 [Morchella importuna]|nr:uncharacterized protein LAJ45_08309 [Morchella importuna]KAH8147482.1 hypothetical protein LAJ45_08309 [Morchella importuna]
MGQTASAQSSPSSSPTSATFPPNVLPFSNNNNNMHPTAASRSFVPEVEMLYPKDTMTETTVLAALEYVSQKLIAKGIHVQMILEGEALGCLFLGSRDRTSSLNLHPTTLLTPRTQTHLTRALHRASQKFSLPPTWARIAPTAPNSTLLHRSLLQNEIIFSSEGLTVLAVDLCFALKCKLEAVSSYCDAEDVEDAVVLLRRLVRVYRGRPLTKGYILRSWPKIVVSDLGLLRVGREYEWRYGGRGVAGVNDEYMGWRREGGVGWDVGLEELERMGRDSGTYGCEKGMPDVMMDFEAIFRTDREDNWSCR